MPGFNGSLKDELYALIQDRFGAIDEKLRSLQARSSAGQDQDSQTPQTITKVSQAAMAILAQHKSTALLTMQIMGRLLLGNNSGNASNVNRNTHNEIMYLRSPYDYARDPKFGGPGHQTINMLEINRRIAHSLLRRYEEGDTAAMSLLLCGGKGGGKKGNGNNGKKGSGKKGSGKKGNNGNNGKKGNNGNKGSGKDNKTDEDVCRALSPECASRGNNKNPAEQMRAMQALAEWYANLRRTFEEPIKRLMDDSVEANKVALKCMPLSVKERLRDMKSFVENLNTYYISRLNDLYSDAYKKYMVDSVEQKQNHAFSDTDGNLYSDLTSQEALLSQKFESKQLLYNFVNIWRGIIDPNFYAMREKAREGLQDREPAESFRHVYYNPKRDKFWFLWTARDSELKNSLATVVELAADANSQVKLDVISYAAALSSADDERLVRLSMANTHNLEYIRNH